MTDRGADNKKRKVFVSKVVLLGPGWLSQGSKGRQTKVTTTVHHAARVQPAV